MDLATPFIPTPEEIARYQHLSHPQSTGLPAPAPAPAPAAQAHPGSALAAYAPVQAMPGQQQQPPPRPPLAQFVLTAEQLAALVIQPRPALLDQWLCQGDLGYIYAPRGVGKTWLAMALPGAISCRRPLGLWKEGDPIQSSSSSLIRSAHPAGSLPAVCLADARLSSSSLSDTSSGQEADPDAPPAPAPDHIPVLYIDGEMALKHTQYRARGLDLSKVHHLHHEHMFNQNGTALNIGEPEDRQRITDLIIQNGYKVLILDNLSSLATGVDENKGMDYEPLSLWLLDLRRRKITVIVVHHAGRNGLMRGHSKREDACSWIIELRDARQEADPGAKFVSHFAKPSRNTGDPLPDLLWHFTTDKVTGITDIHCELAQEDEYEQFIQHVIDGVTSQKDIAELMVKPKGTICKWAKRALQQGRLGGSTTRLQPPTEHTNTRSFHEKEEDGEDDENSCD